MHCKPGKWIPCALEHHKPGSLHRMLHVPKAENIPVALLQKVKNADVGDDIKHRGFRIPITNLLKSRANLAKNLGGFNK